MPSTTSIADVRLETEPAEPQTKRIAHERPDSDTPFRILVMGDFSGRDSRGVVGRGPRKAVAVDRDNFDRIFAGLNVKLRLPVAGGDGLEIEFKEFDDFLPDRLYQRLPVFQKLRELRRELEDPKTFQKAVKTLGVTDQPKPAPPPPPSQAKTAASLLKSGSFLDEVVEQTVSLGSGAAAAKTALDPLQLYIRALVTPHLTPKADPKQGELLKEVDKASGASVGVILHHPMFQQLEAAWRSLYFLVRELETGPMLKVFLLDISRSELASDLAQADDLRSTAMYKLLVEDTVRTPGAHPWAVIVGDYSFGPNMSDLNLLGRLGLLARQAKAPFLAGASPKLIGCRSLVESPYPEDWRPGEEREGWNIIRSLPEARYLGLALPRIMLRLPYGKGSDAPELFEFEEMAPGRPVHDHYLWGNPAYMAACLLGQTFSEFGWAMDGGEILSVRGLPAHVWKDTDGEARITPPAELFLTQSSMERIHELGIMTMLSWQNSDQVRLGGFRSVSEPVADLLGRWG